jgi:hypothetical protein
LSLSDLYKNISKLDMFRKEYAGLVQEFKEYQKECGAKKDIDGAKYFKEEARWAQKHYRGLCAVLDYAGSDSGDCSDALKSMNLELAPYADCWFMYAFDMF